MKKRYYFYSLLAVLLAFIVWLFAQPTPPPCPCQLPQIGEMNVMITDTSTTGIDAEIELVAKAKYFRWLLDTEAGMDANFDWESAIRKTKETSYSQDFFQWYKGRRLDICTLMNIICMEEKKDQADQKFLRDTKYKLVNYILELEDNNSYLPQHFSSEAVQKIENFYHTYDAIAQSMEQQVNELPEGIQHKRQQLILTRFTMVLRYLQAELNDHQFQEVQLDLALLNAASKLNTIQQKFAKKLPS